MTPFPRPDYARLERYDPERTPVRLDLSDNTNLWGTHPAALARIRAATSDDLARYPELYADELRNAVAARFGVEPACVTTGAGSDDVLDSAWRAAYAPGSRISYAAPTFSMVEPFARMNGMDARAVPWADALADPGTLLAGDPALVYVCRPNNPTGQAAPLSWVEELLARRGDGGPLVVVDEAYADFADDSFLAKAPEYDRLLVARTASKAYGLAGLRCGYAVGNADVVLEVDKSRGPYKVSGLAASAVAIAILDESGWMARTVEACLVNRDRLHRELATRGLRPLESRTNFILCAAPSGDARRDAATLRDAGVGVRPFSGIPDLDEGLRITVGPWERMEDFLQVLDHSLLAEEDGLRTGVSS